MFLTTKSASYSFKPRKKSSNLKYKVIFWGFAILVIVFFVGFKHYLDSKSQAAKKVQNIPTKKLLNQISPGVSLTACQKILRDSTEPTVGIQAGHYQIADLPDEQANLRWDFGASYNGVNEVDINYDVANKIVTILKDEGINAQFLPATVPPDYCADAFVAIHADGNSDTTVYGYKVTASHWDSYGNAQKLSNDIQHDYGQITDMAIDPTVTNDMTQYYAFNYEKFVHAVDQYTPGALIELGFITNPTDQARMLNDSQTLAQGVASGIVDYLNGKDYNVPIYTPQPTPSTEATPSF
jgi:hypothetical protein